jgi:hypothetical protein
MWKASPILAARVEHEQVALMNTSTEEEWKPCKRTEQSMDRQANMPMCWSPDRNFPRVRDATVQRFSGPFSDFTDGHTHALECASRRERRECGRKRKQKLLLTRPRSPPRIKLCSESQTSRRTELD